MLVPQCRTVTRQVCEEAGYGYGGQASCHDVLSQECEDEARQQCDTVEETQCRLVDRQQCQQVPQQVCEESTSRQCAQVSVLHDLYLCPLFYYTILTVCRRPLPVPPPFSLLKKCGKCPFKLLLNSCPGAPGAVPGGAAAAVQLCAEAAVP